MSTAVRFVKTVKYLKPVQVFNQVKRYLPKLMPKIPGYKGTWKGVSLLISELDLSDDYTARFRVDRLLENNLFLLNEEHELSLMTWNNTAASHLWNFNLHYLEYCVALAAEYRKTDDKRYYDKTIEIITSWIANNPFGKGDGWHPYTISMRLPNILIAIELLGGRLKDNGDIFESIKVSLYKQYRFLFHRLELQQLGNHYLENLKSIVIGSVVFGERDAYNKFIKKLEAEIDEEVLPDGMHFELSPMYQKIVLEDILRLFRVVDSDSREFLKPYLSRMAAATDFLEKGFNRTPLFNDSGDNVAKKTVNLLNACKQNNIKWSKVDALPTAGYYKLADGQITVIIDAGRIGPDYMPGHGHCDCLSFELAIGGEPLFVNSGTLQYQGNMRSYFRSTRAHNTVSIDSKEQSDCWGEHRVGERICRVKGTVGGNTFKGEYMTFNGSVHEREISLSDGKLTVIDTVPSGSKVTSYLHIGSGFEVREAKNTFSILKEGAALCSIKAINADAEIHSDDELTSYAPEFGLLKNTRCIEFQWSVDQQRHGYEIDFESNLYKD